MTRDFWVAQWTFSSGCLPQARRAFTFANGSTYTGEWLGADLFLVKQHEENVTCLPEIPDTDTEM
jgi:hypothetical protein